MPDEEKVHVRFGFVELLFALTAAEIAVQFADLVSKVEAVAVGLPAYAHLTLAFILVATSWVGWSRSIAPGAKRDVQAVFSADFIVLLIDVLLVIFYFIVVKGVDQIIKNTDGSVAVVASANNECLWIAVIFAGYFLWDVMTKAVIGTDNNKRIVLGFRILEMSFWSRGWISAACLVLAIIAWYFLKDLSGPTQVIVADLALLALVLLFRALKQRAHIWSLTLVLCFAVAVISVAP
jgi:hypothetical protein